jgi:hypothetical protein
MRSRWKALAGAGLLASAAGPASLAQVSGIVPPRPKGQQVKCEGMPKTSAPACCFLAITIDAEGKSVKAAASCSDPAFEAPVVRCQGSQEFFPATQAGKPIPYTARIRILFNDRGDAASQCANISPPDPG